MFYTLRGKRACGERLPSTRTTRVAFELDERTEKKKNVFERVYKEIKILMLLGKEIKYAAHCVRYANFRFRFGSRARGWKR